MLFQSEHPTRVYSTNQRLRYVQAAGLGSLVTAGEHNLLFEISTAIKQH